MKDLNILFFFKCSYAYVIKFNTVQGSRTHFRLVIMSKMLQLKPSEIFYSQDTISNRFGRQPPCKEKLLGTTLDELLSKSIVKSDIPNITVIMRDGKFYTADNRRLWVFKKAEEAGNVHEIDVKRGNSINFRTKNGTKFTTTNGGISIRIRGDPGGVFWRKLISEPNVFLEDNEHKLGNILLRAHEPSVVRKTEFIEYNKSASDVRRFSIFKSSCSNDFSHDTSDSISRNMESPICEREGLLSYGSVTQYTEEEKVRGKSFEDFEYSSNPSSLHCQSVKDKQDHSRLLVSTPKTPRLYSHVEQNSYKKHAKENEEGKKARIRPTTARCNRDTSLMKEVNDLKDSIKSNQLLNKCDILKLQLQLLSVQFQLRLLKLEMDRFINLRSI